MDREDPADGSASERCLSDELASALEEGRDGGMTLGRMLERLGHRGPPMLLFILTTPFILPIPTMGLSAPAGFIAAFVGLTVVLGLRPWVPGFVLRRRLSYQTLERVLGATSRVTRRLERFLKPRLGFMLWPGARSLIGLSLILGGFMLSLPIPIPGTNAVPAAAILLLCLALAERDGAMALAGHAIVLASLGIVWASWEATRAAVTGVFGA